MNIGVCVCACMGGKGWPLTVVDVAHELLTQAMQAHVDACTCGVPLHTHM